MRSVPRWVALMAVLTVVALVCAFTVHRVMTPAVLVLHLSEAVVPADGFSSAELKIHASNGSSLKGLRLEVETPHQVTLESLTINADSATASLQAGVLPGDAKIRVIAPGVAPLEVSFRTTPDYNDAVGDGTPDFLRLHDPADRLAFRHWFTLLAESQYYRAKPLPEVDDCAALLRFAYREAMRAHDASWAHAIVLPAPASAADVKQYQYPYTPLGANLFRIRSGSFTGDNLRDGAVAQFADAETLWRHNTFSVGRNLARAHPGDLLFFRQDGSHMPFHAMIFVGHSQVEPGSEQFIVYDTGPEGNASGIVKRLSVAELQNYPDARWRAIASNPAFLGVYRWNILRGGE